MVDISSHPRETFLRGPDVEREAKELISQAARIRVAVAYWGSGSFKRIDAESLVNKDIVIVCDLMSGACDAAEIESLQKTLGKSRVLTRDRLHAKVWLADRGAIVGSSNVSANGLGFEGDELKGSIEANVFIDDAEAAAAIDSWFENDVLDEAREIKKADFKEARRRRKRHRITRPQPFTEGSLLEALRMTPSSFADRAFVVWVEEELPDLDPWADHILLSEQKARSNSRILCWQDVEDPVPPQGSHILEFQVDKNGKAGLDGLYQILGDDPLVKRRNGNLLLCKPVKTFEGLPLGDRKTWERAATAAGRTGREEWTIEAFGRKFLSNTV
jgi:hypothetical protein